MKIKKIAKNMRAQASAELMVYLAFFMLIFVVFLLFMLSDFNSDISRRQFIYTKATADQVGDYAAFAIAAGPGFSANFSIPTHISGKEYSIRLVSSGWMYVDIDDEVRGPTSYSYPLGFSNFSLGCSPSSQCTQNSHRRYISVEGIPYEETKISPAKGWIFFNHTRDAFGEWIEVQ